MELSSFELIKKGVSTIIDVVDAFARTELVRLENLINNLATVARTGSYNDLTDKPVIPTPPELSEVAYTGEYDDLLNKPTLFSGNYNDLTNKPNLSLVAISGSYNDLSNKPTIPTKTSQLQNDNNLMKMVTNSEIQNPAIAQISVGYSTSVGGYIIRFGFPDNTWFRIELTTTKINLRNQSGLIWSK